MLFYRKYRLQILCFLVCVVAACAPVSPEPPVPHKPSGLKLNTLGFSVQVGAFSQLDNAVRLEGCLENRGLEAYYFLHDSGLYKVCFGNFKTYKQARARALALQRKRVIGSFFIVFPEDYAVYRIAKTGYGDLRRELVKTARKFIGVPYKWGGTSPKKGFDCSGLALVVYRLNGLDLPRASFQQFEAGTSVGRRDLMPGDLVFFATRKSRRVSHVGIYIGDDRFIHAPRRGKKVCIASLNSSYYAKRYMGGRNYL